MSSIKDVIKFSAFSINCAEHLTAQLASLLMKIGLPAASVTAQLAGDVGVVEFVSFLCESIVKQINAIDNADAMSLYVKKRCEALTGLVCRYTIKNIYIYISICAKYFLSLFHTCAPLFFVCCSYFLFVAHCYFFRMCVVLQEYV